jgi:hypothetical protein
LGGAKAGVLPGMMAAMTRLLGVGCSHCHVVDQWASDDKPAKRIARRHFEMMDVLTKDYFDNQERVSCWTCHRGQPIPPSSH